MDAGVETPYKPFRVISTPLISAHGKTYRISDKFSLKKGKKATFKVQSPADGKNYKVTLNPRGTFKIYETMNLPSGAMKLKAKKFAIKRSQEEQEGDYKRAMLEITKE